MAQVPEGIGQLIDRMVAHTGRNIGELETESKVFDKSLYRVRNGELKARSAVGRLRIIAQKNGHTFTEEEERLLESYGTGNSGPTDLPQSGPHGSWIRYIEPEIDRCQLASRGLLPPKKATRGIYLGCSGADCWNRLVESFEGYRLQQKAGARLIADLLVSSGSTFRTVVSLGPGDGELDAELLRKLPVRPSYIPVDISHALVTVSHLAVERHALDVPFDVLADFEDNLDLVVGCCRMQVHPFLWLLTGNTITNLWEGELTFLERMYVAMDPGDAIAIDIKCFYPSGAWNVEEDRWFDLEAVPSEAWGEGFRAAQWEFLRQAACRIGTEVEEDPKEFIKQVRPELQPTDYGTCWHLKYRGRSLLRTCRYILSTFSEKIKDIGFQITERDVPPVNGLTTTYLLLIKPASVS